ncbi:NAD(P)-dependent oxidoreductase [Phormidium sp. CLA17]|uniref:NAD-dependent epimerase/dehydratase family protein n=1 Tax=Leptolyngbya sp. Cla-17 TaxID=2803751 RepID=UPI001491A1B0|nr:NAD(P)-dependent oxidoreductase [Leptolyngbya sp. Cla-17]MBM0742233.1 NAD(P)-dependent oxidoreductase [Leptolyngbya sp. Cla-17]
MTSKRIFVTGASGCIGHYIVEALIQETNHDLFLLVRNLNKLKIDYGARPGITVLEGNMREIEQFGDLLKTMDCAILIATSWGGPEEVFDINVVKTIRLLNLLDPEVCRQVIYFSTASILDRNNQPMKEAGEIGTDYVRSKYNCFQQFSKLAIGPNIITLFPTLLLGGEAQKPWSHISGGISKEAKWINFIRFFSIDGSFHYIHSRDVAQVVRYLVDNPLDEEDCHNLVLGNPAITADQAIAEACAYLDKRLYFRIPLTQKLLDIIFKLFRIQMEDWDRFAINYRHFVHTNPVTPSTFGLPTYCSSFEDVLKVSGVPQKKQP